jgi:molecular chaperone DnaK
MRGFVCPPPNVAWRLGVETSDGMMLPLIERGSSFPISRTITFSTAVDGQTSVEIPILRGLRVLAKDNQQLHTLSLHRILPAPQGVPQIEVTFAIDMAETLEVTAKDWATGETASTCIHGALSLSREEANRLYGDAAQNERIDVAIDPAKFRRPIADLIHQMQDEAPRSYFDSRIPAIDITKLKKLLEQLHIAIAPLENSNCLKPATSSTTMLPIVATTLIGTKPN